MKMRIHLHFCLRWYTKLIREFILGFYHVCRSWYCIVIVKKTCVWTLLYSRSLHHSVLLVVAVNIALLVVQWLSLVVSVKFQWVDVFIECLAKVGERQANDCSSLDNGILCSLGVAQKQIVDWSCIDIF